MRFNLRKRLTSTGLFAKSKKSGEKNSKGPKIAGGLGLYVKKHLSHLVEVIPNDCNDSIWVKISNEKMEKSNSIYLGTFYVSPQTKKEDESFFKEFNDEVISFSRKGPILIQGDLNARTASEKDYVDYDENDPFLFGESERQGFRNSQDSHKNQRGGEVNDTCKLHNLLILNGRKTGDIFGKFTCHNWNGSSVVDYMISSDYFANNITHFSVGDYIPWLSDHCILKTKLDDRYSLPGEGVNDEELEKVHPGFVWNEKSAEIFRKNLKSLSTEVRIRTLLIDENPDPTALAESIKDILGKNACSNLKTIKTDGEKETSEPWFDKECADCKIEISRLGKELANAPKDLSVRSKISEKKKYFRKIALAKKRRHKNDVVASLESKRHSGKPKDFWKALRKLSPKNKRDTVHPSMSEFLGYFKNLSRSNREQNTPDICKENGPLDFTITLKELLDACKNLKNGKASGFDNISNEMIKILVEVYPELVLKLFNAVLASGRTVPDWMVGLIVPIFKDGAKTDPSNYRGITLISCLSKLFLSILNARLIKFALDKGIISINQLGFTAGNRCSDAHIIINTLVNKTCHKNGSKIFSCFVDFKKAFDSVPRDTLLKKLHSFGITGKFFNVIRNIYTTDKAGIKQNNFKSSLFDLNIGVRQGCIMSPILFNIFLCDLAKSLHEMGGGLSLDKDPINSIFWADDLVMFANSEKKLQEMLNLLDAYCKENELLINTKKTKCMIFNKSGRILSRDFFLNNTKLEIVRSYKYLGFILTPSGEIKTGLKDLRDRGFKAFMKLRRDLGVSFNQHIPTTLFLVESLIKPIILYCSDFWGCINLPRSLSFEDLYKYNCKTNPVEKLFSSICKQILGVQKQTPNTGVLLEMGQVPIHHFSVKFSVKNWERIKKGQANKLLISAYNESETLNLPWTNGIKRLLNSVGMSTFYTSLYPNKLPFIFKKIAGRMSDIFNQNSFEIIKVPSNKLRTYAIFKKNAGFEDYLVQVKSVKERQMVSKFRLSNHRLMIEIGRHRGIENAADRTCPFCPGVMEDEFHFLFDCITYRLPRQNLLAPIFDSIHGFEFLSRDQKLEILMCKMDVNLCKYIYRCSEIRSFLDAKPRQFA